MVTINTSNMAAMPRSHETSSSSNEKQIRKYLMAFLLGMLVTLLTKTAPLENRALASVTFCEKVSEVISAPILSAEKAETPYGKANPINLQDVAVDRLTKRVVRTEKFSFSTRHDDIRAKQQLAPSQVSCKLPLLIFLKGDTANGKTGRHG